MERQEEVSTKLPMKVWSGMPYVLLFSYAANLVWPPLVGYEMGLS